MWVRYIYFVCGGPKLVGFVGRFVIMLLWLGVLLQRSFCSSCCISAGKCSAQLLSISFFFSIFFQQGHGGGVTEGRDALVPTEVQVKGRGDGRGSCGVVGWGLTVSFCVVSCGAHSTAAVAEASCLFTRVST